MKAEKHVNCSSCSKRSVIVWPVVPPGDWGCGIDNHRAPTEAALFLTCPLPDWPSVSRKDIIEILELTSDVEKDMVYGMDTNLGTEDELVEAVAAKLRASGIEVKEQKEETK